MKETPSLTAQQLQRAQPQTCSSRLLATFITKMSPQSNRDLPVVTQASLVWVVLVSKH